MTFKERYQYDPKTDLLGKGGFSKVYRAEDRLLNRVVALKIFPSEASDKYDLLAEIRRVIALEHPNLCRYYDVNFVESVNGLGETEQIQVGVMEYLDGGDLKSYLEKNPFYTERLLTDVLNGLAFLHRKGIIHRDLKPQNILIKLTEEGPVARITDFGISKLVNGGDYSKSTALMGTIEYMAPEQFNPARYGIDSRIATNVDLWSFGSMAYELVTGESLFGIRSSVTSAEQVMSNILGEGGYDDKLQKLPPHFARLIGMCLIKDAKQRAQSAEELIPLLAGTIKHKPFGITSKRDISTRQIISGEMVQAPESEQMPIPEAATTLLKSGGETAGLQANTPSMPEVMAPKPKSRTRSGILIGLVIFVLGVSVGGYLYYNYFRKLKDQQKEELNAALRNIEKNMVSVQGGSIVMEETNGKAKPGSAYVSNFRINKYEVTQKEWRAIMGMNPANHQNCDSCPTEHVSWDEVQNFIIKLNQLSGKAYRLPWEAEWGYAARGGNKTHNYDYAGGSKPGKVSWNIDNSGNMSHPVGTRVGNELGLYDMSGNVWEWCEDWADSSRQYHNIRGGGYEGNTRVTEANKLKANQAFNNCGFRLAAPL